MDKVTVYGIVVGISALECAQLLKLDMNLKEGQSNFVLCSRHFDFDLIPNVVVSCL